MLSRIAKILIAHKGKTFHNESGYEWEQAAQRDCAICLSLETLKTWLEKLWAAWSHLEVRSAWSRGLDQTSSRGSFWPKSVHSSNMWLYSLNINGKRNWLGQKPDVVNSNDYIFLHILTALLIAAILTMVLKPVTIQNACPEQNLGVFASCGLHFSIGYNIYYSNYRSLFFKEH